MRDLVIKRKDGMYRVVPKENTALHPGDTVAIFNKGEFVAEFTIAHVIEHGNGTITLIPIGECDA